MLTFLVSLLSLIIQLFVLKVILNIQLVRLKTGYFLYYDYRNETRVLKLWRIHPKKVIIKQVKPEAKTDTNDNR